MDENHKDIKEPLTWDQRTGRIRSSGNLPSPACNTSNIVCADGPQRQNAQQGIVTDESFKTIIDRLPTALASKIRHNKFAWSPHILRWMRSPTTPCQQTSSGDTAGIYMSRSRPFFLPFRNTLRSNLRIIQSTKSFVTASLTNWDRYFFQAHEGF